MKLLILFMIGLDYLSRTSCEDDDEMEYGGIFDQFINLFEENGERLRTIQHPNQTIPEEFDAREKWPECKSIGRIQQQGKCNIGFLFAFTAAFADRVCIKTSGQWQLPFSPEDVIACCFLCWRIIKPLTCKGMGSEISLIEHMAQRGLATGGDVNSGIGCIPVSEATISGRLGEKNCSITCTNSNYNRSYFSDKLRLSDVLVSAEVDIPQVQIEIMKNGPVLAPLIMGDDLQMKLLDRSFTGVYFRRLRDGHLIELVRVIGWGIEENVPYWLIASTYNTTRFFKIRRGKNTLNIEEYMLALVPNLYRRPDQDDTKSGCETLGAISYLCFMFATFHLLFVKLSIQK